jgi:hypothetical protein
MNATVHPFFMALFSSPIPKCASAWAMPIGVITAPASSSPRVPASAQPGGLPRRRPSRHATTSTHTGTDAMRGVHTNATAVHTQRATVSAASTGPTTLPAPASHTSRPSTSSATTSPTTAPAVTLARPVASMGSSSSRW